VRPGGAEGLVYGRFNGPDQEILEDRLCLWEETEDALTFATGLAAIATALLTFVRPGDIIVHSAPLYAATETLIGKILSRLGVSFLDFPASATQPEIEAVLRAAAAKGRVSVIYLESPANPTNALVDVEAVAAARQKLATPGRGLTRISVEMGLTGVLATQLWHHLYLAGDLCDLQSKVVKF